MKAYTHLLPVILGDEGLQAFGKVLPTLSSAAEGEASCVRKSNKIIIINRHDQYAEWLIDCYAMDYRVYM